MKKSEIIKELEKLVSIVEDRKNFTENYMLNEEQYYPTAYGYLIGSLEFLINNEKNK